MTDTNDATDRLSAIAGNAHRALLAARGGATAVLPSPHVDEPAPTDDVDEAPTAEAGAADASDTAATDADADVADASDTAATDADADVADASDTADADADASDTAATDADADVADAIGTGSGPDADTIPTLPQKPTTKPTTKPIAGRARTSRFTLAAALVLAAAVLFTGIAGVIRWRAGHDSTRDLALARDAVAIDARLDIATVNSSDYHHPTNALASWLDVTTGTLHTEYAQSRAAATKLIGESKMTSTATVLDVAVTAVDLGKGTATVLASVNLVRHPATGSATTVRNRLSGTLTKVGGRWKLSNLTIVAVALS